MPELRKDPITGRWVIISTERGKRPNDFLRESVVAKSPKNCPFCPGSEGEDTVGNSGVWAQRGCGEYRGLEHSRGAEQVSRAGD